MKVYSFCFIAMALLARYELRTDDAGIVAGLIVVITFVLGCLHPRHAWQWALLVGPAVPAADLLFRSASPRDMLLLTGFVLVLGFAGSYAGVVARKVIGAVGAV